VLENVALPLLLDGHDSAAAYTLAAEWLDRAGLADHDTTSARICGSCCSARRATAARQSSSSRRAGAANVRRIVSEKHLSAWLTNGPSPPRPPRFGLEQGSYRRGLG
jgi:hypothetical protein